MKKVTIIIPCRNEDKFIGKVLDNILIQDYSVDLMEVFIVDGMSTDKTREIIQFYCNQYNHFYMLDNPENTVPYALNKAILKASGNIIIRLDAHAIYPSNYVSTLVNYLNKLNTDNVGGALETIPANNSLKARSIAIAISTPFGVGNASYRVIKNEDSEYIPVDTVPFGCYKKEVFEKYGLFDEQLTRNQDNEFNERIISGGGKIYLIPSLKIKYFARENYSKLFRMFFQYGYFGPLVDIKLKRPTRLRRYIPMLFIFSLILPQIIYFVFKPFFYISLVTGLFYLITVSTISIYESIKNKSISLIPYMMYAYFISHISYGTGYISGIVDFAIRKKHKKNKLDMKLSR